MKIIVLGAGMVGSAIAADLKPDYNVCCADINPEALKIISNKYKIKTLECDFSNLRQVKKIIEPFDLMVGAVPGFLGFDVLKTVIESGKNVVDISFFPEEAFELDALARDKNVTAIVDCGVAPGLCNMMLGYENNLMNIRSYECLVGGLPVKPEPPYNYKAPFSPADVIEEYVRPARYVKNKKIVVKEALSEIEAVHFDECGLLEAFNTDGLRSLILTMSHIPEMKEKTLRYPGHALLMRTFRESGFFDKQKLKVKGGKISPLDVFSKLLFEKWKYNNGEEDFTTMRVAVRGKSKGKSKKIVYSLFDKYDRKTQTMSMARTTGYTCTAAARLVIEKKYKVAGISPPEFIGADEECFNYVLNYLAERNVKVKKTMIG